METGFDKEIDTLLRDRGLRTITTAERSIAGEHLDADALSGFAENALPANTRAVYVSHLADCDDCRAVLSNIIAMQEPTAAKEAVAAPVIELAPVPWYRRLLRGPNLAYVMGGLVLIFGGLITVSLLQNSAVESDSAISQSREMQQPVRGPMMEDTDTFASNAASSEDVAANAAASANTAIPKPMENDMARSPANVLSERREESELAREVSVMRPSATPAPPAGEFRDGANLADLAAPRDAEVADLVARQQQAPVAGAPPATQAGPSRNIQRDNRALEGRARAVQPAAKSSEATTRVVGEKNFELRDGVWFDSAYKGEATVDVRRGSEEYRKLDSGLRLIAQRFREPVVTVWNGKAYRIE